MYEKRTHRPLTTGRFAARMLGHAAVALGLVAGSLLIGMAGYTGLEGLAWRDAFLNTAMLLGGMGPVDPPKTNGGKIFAGLYALYAGLAFIVFAGLLVAPFLHRLLHKFHWETDGQ
jgi:hypothetical protein